MAGTSPAMTPGPAKVKKPKRPSGAAAQLVAA
jgi:hypothetical protein